jgi:hypothetical protein
MAYVNPNFKTKKQLKQALEQGMNIQVYNPGLGYPIPKNGSVALEGPHYPEPHRWYATGTLKEGKLVKVS